MNEENEVMKFVNEQFKQVNTKLDKLTELTEQTHLQEYRISQLEKIEKSKSDTFGKIITPIFSAVISAVMSFIIAGGLKA